MKKLLKPMNFVTKVKNIKKSIETADKFIFKKVIEKKGPEGLGITTGIDEL